MLEPMVTRLQHQRNLIAGATRNMNHPLASFRDADALGGEDADEAHVEVLQSKDPHVVLAVVVERHGEHVEADEHHDDHIKLLVGDDSKDNGLWSPLKQEIVVLSLLLYKLVHTVVCYLLNL